MASTNQDTPDQPDVSILNWGPEAPRGGKAVMGRILKENATVPLFFGQTMIQSLRDVGYNHTTSAFANPLTTRFKLAPQKFECTFGRRAREAAIRPTLRSMTTAPA